MSIRMRCACPPGSPFHWMEPGYKPKIEWAPLQKSRDSGDISSETINAKRAKGVDVATIHGLSKRTHAHDLDPKRFHVYSKAGAAEDKR